MTKIDTIFWIGLFDLFTGYSSQIFMVRLQFVIFSQKIIHGIISPIQLHELYVKLPFVKTMTCSPTDQRTFVRLINPSGILITWLLEAVVGIDTSRPVEAPVVFERDGWTNPLSKWLWAGGSIQLVALCTLTTRCFQVHHTGAPIKWGLWRLHDTHFLYTFLLCKKKKSTFGNIHCNT